MLTLKLSPTQRSAIEIYITDPAHAEDKQRKLRAG